ncbi:MAG: TRAP transporter small permease subunit [Alphaproteobacteria bacterium]|nr:TRAP transporter small permease subunit [Alphaproteobacteria bacterium]MCW5743797.1 TRAP transporter small permease subunit [Alphaproteobacteria bacterium]
MRALVRTVDGLSRFFGALAALLVIVLVVLMLYDVVMRYVFDAPTIWGNDLNTWLMGASFVLSIAYAMSTDSHVRVDLLYDRRTRPRIRYFDLAGLTLIVLPTVAFLSWGLYDHFLSALKSGERSGTGGWNPITWPFKLVMFVGFAIFTLQILAEIIKRIASLSGKPFEPPEEAADGHGV